MTSPELRLPAEWEPQSAVLLAWPHAGTDWAERLDSVEGTCAALIAAITRFETAIVCTPDAEIGAHAAGCLREAGADLERVRFVEIPYDDTWLRDSGPITLRDANGRFVLADFRFTGWGGKFEASQDDALVAGLIERGVFRRDAQRQRVDWALEGGAIESDGRGTILTTGKCLQQRHPDQSRETIDLRLRTGPSGHRLLWLVQCSLQGGVSSPSVEHASPSARLCGR